MLESKWTDERPDDVITDVQRVPLTLKSATYANFTVVSGSLGVSSSPAAGVCSL